MRVTHLPMLALLAAVGLGCASTPVQGQDGEPEDNGERPSELTLRTPYLTEAVAGAHRITILGVLAGNCRVSLDPNTCSLDQFGDPAVCTRIAVRTVPVTFERLQLKDPTGQGRQVYQLHGDLPASLYLVVPRNREAGFRLIAKLTDDYRQVIALEHQPAVKPRPRPKPTPRLCEDAEYHAFPRGGRVHLVASGSHNTGGYRVSLVQLPIEIYPPEFRLECEPPKGPAIQVITPFEVTASFPRSGTVKSVVVHDARGRRLVPVRAK